MVPFTQMRPLVNVCYFHLLSSVKSHLLKLQRWISNYQLLHPKQNLLCNGSALLVVFFIISYVASEVDTTVDQLRDGSVTVGPSPNLNYASKNY